ncbi:MAG: transcriptional repressor [Actinomycetota bacterium]|nr:transcriptional repressor [Actinomycetota bacterium]
MEPGRVRHATRQGDAINEVLNDVAEFRAPQEIHAELRRRGRRVGLTTVYRHLALLADRGAVDVLRTASGQTVYRRCAAESHHHHLICRSCGKTVEFEGPEVERWAEAVARAARFHDVSHTVEIFGTCDDCAAGQAPSRPAGRADGS